MASPPSTTLINIEETTSKDLLDRVRSLLQRDKVRLWESPYTHATTKAENIPEA
jgi:hypothetical protein